MNPALGDTVITFADPFYNNGADEAPARITRVWPDGTVNVRVTHDGPSVPPPHRMDWLTSVPLYASREAAEAAHAEKWDGAPGPVQPFAAFWPPAREA